MPNARPSDPWGVDPDPGLEVVTSPELRRLLRRWRFQMEARMPGDDRALPLDDEENDPVLAAALRHLRSEVDAARP